MLQVAVSVSKRMEAPMDKSRHFFIILLAGSIDFFAGLRDYYTDLNTKIPGTITLYKNPPCCSL